MPSVQVWSIGQPTADFTLEGHEQGVSCVDYFAGGAHRAQRGAKEDHTLCCLASLYRVMVWTHVVDGGQGSTVQQTQALRAHGLRRLTCPHCISCTVINHIRCLAGDRPLLLSGADDRLVKVWDYQTKACVQTLEGHAHNVTAVMFHPELPVILTGCATVLEARQRGQRHDIPDRNGVSFHTWQSPASPMQLADRRNRAVLLFHVKTWGLVRPFVHHDGFL